MPISQIKMHEPQWFVLHSRIPSQIEAGNILNQGHVIWCSERDIDARKAAFSAAYAPVIGYIGCGFDLEDALRRALAIDQLGGWDKHASVQLHDADYFEITAAPEDLPRLADGLPVAFETGPTFAIRSSDLAALASLGSVDVPFSIEVSGFKSHDIWPEESYDDAASHAP